MAVGARLVSLFTLSSVAVLLCSFHASPVVALSVEYHPARALHNPAHDALAKRKRSNNKRCKPRPSPSPASTTPFVAPSSAPAPASSTPAAAPPAPSSSSPAQSSAAPAPSPSPAAPAGNINLGGSSKAGLGWPNGETWLDKWAPLVKTIYTWNPTCPSNAQSLGVTCCPMLWGWNQVGQWQSEVLPFKQQCAMGPNEPEITTQSNMDAGSGVALWNQYIRNMKKDHGTTLISPVTTSDPNGKTWMLDFFRICGGDCDVDIVAVHWYDISGDAMIAYLKDLHAAYNKPLWVTEFACQNFNDPKKQCTQDQVWGFQSQVTAFMEQADFVLKYMPFGAGQNMDGVNPLNQLINGDGSPNALAFAYFQH